MKLASPKRFQLVRPIKGLMEVFVDVRYGSINKHSSGVRPALQGYTDLIRHIVLGSCQYLNGKVGRLDPVIGRSGKCASVSPAIYCRVLP